MRNLGVGIILLFLSVVGWSQSIERVFHFIDLREAKNDKLKAEYDLPALIAEGLFSGLLQGFELDTSNFKYNYASLMEISKKIESMGSQYHLMLDVSIYSKNNLTYYITNYVHIVDELSDTKSVVAVKYGELRNYIDKSGKFIVDPMVAKWGAYCQNLWDYKKSYQVKIDLIDGLENGTLKLKSRQGADVTDDLPKSCILKIQRNKAFEMEWLDLMDDPYELKGKGTYYGSIKPKKLLELESENLNTKPRILDIEEVLSINDLVESNTQVVSRDGQYMDESIASIDSLSLAEVFGKRKKYKAPKLKHVINQRSKTLLRILPDYQRDRGELIDLIVQKIQNSEINIFSDDLLEKRMTVDDFRKIILNPYTEENYQSRFIDGLFFLHKVTVDKEFNIKEFTLHSIGLFIPADQNPAAFDKPIGYFDYNDLKGLANGSEILNRLIDDIEENELTFIF